MMALLEDDYNDNIVTWNSKKNQNEDCARKEGRETNVWENMPGCGRSWLREDCLDFYREKLLATTTDSSSEPQISLSPAISVKDRVGLLRLGINKAMGVKKRFPNAQFLEFGVHEGKDLARMATFLHSIEKQKSTVSYNANKDGIASSYTIFHGFDSFEGLPEDWINGQLDADKKPFHSRGVFDTGGESPDIDNLVNNNLKLGDHGRANTARNSNSTQSSLSLTPKYVDNIEFHKGWFHESLPQFLEDRCGIPIAFVHADADLYTSTFTFLRVICARRLFRKGSIIVFDEFWNYPNWENGEYKAWLDIVKEFGLESKYEYFGYHAPHPSAKRFKHYGYQSVGVVITADMN